MTVKPSVSLTDEQFSFAKSLVDAGRYSSLSAVLQQGVDLLRQREDQEMGDTLALKAILEERMKGPFISTEEFDRHLEAMFAEKRKKYGVSG